MSKYEPICSLKSVFFFFGSATDKEKTRSETVAKATAIIT